VKPVRLPPGCARFGTSPWQTGSVTCVNTIGTAPLCSRSAVVTGVLLAKIKSGAMASSSAAWSCNTLPSPAQRYSIERLRPLTHPSSWRPSSNATTRDCASGSLATSPISTPIRRICLGCCARAASGHAAAVPPSATSNSRRPMVTVIRPSRARCVNGRIPRNERAVLVFEEGQNAGCPPLSSASRSEPVRLRMRPGGQGEISPASSHDRGGRGPPGAQQRVQSCLNRTHLPFFVIGSAARKAHTRPLTEGSHALRSKQGSRMTMRPDPTFHASPKLAMEAPPENFAYTLLLSPDFSKPDSPTFSQIVHTVTMPYKGDEFHHFGWNACSSALSPLTGHAFLERRYLIIPGLRSSRIYIVDTKPDPTQAKIHKIIEPEEVFKKTGYSRPHTVHCGPEGIYVSTLGGGGKDGTNGPPGVFIMDCETFDILGRWEIDRGPQNLHYDFWWNLPRDYMVTSKWGLPPQFENGIVPEDLLSNKYGHRIHFWDLRARRNVQTIDLGANHQMALEVRPAHDPVREYGFLGVVVDTTNLEGSIWTW